MRDEGIAEGWAPGPSARSAVDPFIVMDVLARAQALEAEGRRIVHLEVGQPGTGAPEGARRALAAALEAGPLGYTAGLGLPALRARIAARYGERHGVDLDPARVVVTAGASGAFVLAFAALFEAGARVGLGVPGYPSYRAILQAMGCEAVPIATRARDRFQPVPADVAGLAGLIVASPANPTGTILGRAEMGALAAACRAERAALVSDEIYHGLTWSGEEVSALEVWDGAVIVNSFSKYFSMTGWRVGWLVVPPGLVRTAERLAQNLFICASHAGQVAALAAMDCLGELEANRAVYAGNREAMLDGLRAAGLTRFSPPDGAFYVWVDVSGTGMDSRALASALLEEAGVATTPGADFDPARGGGWLRLSYAGSRADVEEGMARIGGWLAGRGG